MALGVLGGGVGGFGDSPGVREKAGVALGVLGEGVGGFGDTPGTGIPLLPVVTA